MHFLGGLLKTENNSMDVVCVNLIHRKKYGIVYINMSIHIDKNLLPLCEYITHTDRTLLLHVLYCRSKRIGFFTPPGDNFAKLVKRSDVVGGAIPNIPSDFKF
jgi:hypothetical protein